jgi:GTP-binding protein LepA
VVVDASQGIEAQTLANVYMAMDLNLEIVGVVNKIDLPGAEPEKVKQEMEDVLGLDQLEIIPISAKLGMGIEQFWRLWSSGSRLRQEKRMLPAGFDIRLLF